MKKIVYTLSALVIASAVFFACKKDKKEVDNETQTVSDNALAEQEFMRIGPSISERAVSTPGVKKGIVKDLFSVFSTCASDSLTGDTAGYAAGAFTNLANLPTLTLDWGTGCSDVDNVNRTGKISATFTKPYDIVGSVITITPNNYTVNGVAYTGTIRITKLAGGNNPSFRTEVINGNCTNGTFSIDWACDKTITYTAGFTTQSDPNDDIISITGNSSGKNRDGRTFSVVIKSALEKMANCKYISKGTLEITPDGLKTRTVDFGNGTCDATGTFTVGGNTFTFTMQ
ncbi:MAG: hypothetical protein Q8M29_11025 [Bacteroidota bacterium]|nr:hypothetical protein [Bacteroidota bacterium]